MGVIASLRFAAAGSGLVGEGGVDILWLPKRGADGLFFFAEGELGLAPTVSSKTTFTPSVTFGVVANISDPNEWSGGGASTTLPIGAAAAARLVFRGVGGQGGLSGFLEKLAYMNNRSQLHEVLQIGFSSSGPAFIKGGLRSNSFSMEFGYGSSPISGREMLGSNYEAIKGLFGPSLLSTLQDNPASIFDYAQRIESMY